MKTIEPIQLTHEAASAIRNNGMTDRRLIEILNSSQTRHAATDKQQRWMAAQILGALGYKFEVSDIKYKDNPNSGPKLVKKTEEVLQGIV